MRRWGWLAVVLFVNALAVEARAQDASTRAQARARFQRGVELFDEERYDAALAELEQAYRIAPSWPVLFNIGQVRARLGHAVEAVDALSR